MKLTGEATVRGLAVAVKLHSNSDPKLVLTDAVWAINEVSRFMLMFLTFDTDSESSDVLLGNSHGALHVGDGFWDRGQAQVRGVSVDYTGGTRVGLRGLLDALPGVNRERVFGKSGQHPDPAVHGHSEFEQTRFLRLHRGSHVQRIPGITLDGLAVL